MTFTIVMFVAFFICIALMWNEGLWSNAITLINIVFAAMLAVNYFELLATWLDGQAPTYSYIWDFIALWAIFVASFAILRAITDNLSKYRVRFKMPVEHAGRVFFAAWAAWVVFQVALFLKKCVEADLRDCLQFA